MKKWESFKHSISKLYDVMYFLKKNSYHFSQSELWIVSTLCLTKPLFVSFFQIPFIFVNSFLNITRYFLHKFFNYNLDIG